MENFTVTVSSVTFAIRGRDILRKKGIRAKIDRLHSPNDINGCGYRLTIYGDPAAARRLLAGAGIRFRETGAASK